MGLWKPAASHHQVDMNVLETLAEAAADATL
jgi:hypothetical protein